MKQQQATYFQASTIEAEESDYLYTKPSQIPNAGKGLFTAISIFKSEVISLFDGDILTQEEITKRVAGHNDQYFINLLDGTIMDSKHTYCFAKYANDATGLSKSPYKNNAEITLDDDDNICLRAIRDIEEGEEIFCSYGKAYWDKHAK